MWLSLWFSISTQNTKYNSPCAKTKVCLYLISWQHHDGARGKVWASLKFYPQGDINGSTKFHGSKRWTNYHWLLLEPLKLWWCNQWMWLIVCTLMVIALIFGQVTPVGASGIDGMVITISLPLNTSQFNTH